MEKQLNNNSWYMNLKKWWGDNVFKTKKQKELNEKQLYRNIEIAIIRWNNSGKRTAGSLTREILKIIENN